MAESTKGCWGPFYWKLYSNRESRASVVSHAPFDFNFSPSPSGPTFRLILGFHPQLDHGERLILSRLHQLHENQSMTDVQVIVKGQKMGGHLNILTTGSPVLSAMFGSDFMERQTRTLEIDDIEPEVFKQMLCYLYTGKAPDLEREDVTEALLIAADKYQIDSLKLLCEESLSFKLKVENVVHLLTLAHHHSANKLLEVILKFIAVHKREVLFRNEWRDLMVRSPELFLKTVEKMVVS